MNKAEQSREGRGFRIGAVSRLTGIAPDTLRVWERRYGSVIPFRSETGLRLYSQEDVSRLSLIKRLVDGGDSISCVANLSREDLEDRIRGAALPPAADGRDQACRVVVMSEVLAGRLRREPPSDDLVDLVGFYETEGQLLEQAAGSKPDVLVLDYGAIQPDQIREIGGLLLRTGASRAIVIYRIAAAATLERLESPRIIPIRGPVTPGALFRWIRLLAARPNRPVRLATDSGIDISGALPPRRFDDATLAKIAAASVTVRCECPHHLVELISSLTAFEAYSEQCEVLNVEDAALHAFLHSATAQARSLLETALDRVVEADDIEVAAPVPGA